LCRVSP
jgi:hypothetical protein